MRCTQYLFKCRWQCILFQYLLSDTFPIPSTLNPLFVSRFLLLFHLPLRAVTLLFFFFFSVFVSCFILFSCFAVFYYFPPFLRFPFFISTSFAFSRSISLLPHFSSSPPPPLPDYSLWLHPFLILLCLAWSPRGQSLCSVTATTVPTTVYVPVHDSISVCYRDISHNLLEMVGRKTLRGIPALKNL